ncbi:thioredoxin family protein [Burkholderia sp. SFA1]|uniref:thioredoxin family protein n=1 Tax=unclassified Caballeronia TaxID=2646786 RepID=UPI001F34D8E6|nr:MULTISPECIES: thioredoxin family protein [unclassified Caballeronia]MCE4545457.1 thioredoxin family protein [Caballeronia sp. PC1]MCE4570883.1 thioredoxin family protein [Caballeronia sp. CLC5]BBP99276.1 thioredoxin family protein [Burkholderia sp. SFA1]
MPTESPTAELGATASAFTLPATDGKTYTLDTLKGENGLVIVFMCNHCPYVKSAMPNLIRDARALQQIGINVAGINSNDATVYTDDAFDRMIAVAQAWQLPFPYLHDETQDVARTYGAVCTPECFGFDRDLRLRYRGRIDASRKEALPDARRDLFEAMRAIAENDETPAAEQYPALGCSIKWKA